MKKLRTTVTQLGFGWRNADALDNYCQEFLKQETERILTEIKVFIKLESQEKMGEKIASQRGAAPEKIEALRESLRILIHEYVYPVKWKANFSSFIYYARPITSIVDLYTQWLKHFFSWFRKISIFT